MKTSKPTSINLGLATAAALLAIATWPADAAAGEAEMAAYVAREEAKEDARLDKIEKKEAAREIEQELRRRMDRGEIEGRLRSPAMIGIGSVLLAGGIAGSVALGIAASNAPNGSGPWCMLCGLERALFIMGSIASAGAGLGAGIPLIALGAREVPAVPGEPDDGARTPPVSYVPKVSVGAGSVTAAWAF